MPNNLQPVIGLEIHVQLKTHSKMFCADDNAGEEQAPNTTISVISTGQPGTLPVPNKKAIEYTIMAGLALNCRIPESFQFERKNYFYPDLPKGYQITSSTNPPCKDGFLKIESDDGIKKIRIHHIHLEEDAAKNFHSSDGRHTLVDFNRAGTPLMEIVTEADIRNPGDAKKFLQELRLIMRYLNISDADMEKGHLRCDANISLTDQMEKSGDVKKFYLKTEIKNLNSFRSVERALEYEIKRQKKIWESGQKPHQATRGWDDNTGVTEEQRIKEELHDYRYFPEPDIPPINFSQKNGIDINEIQQRLPELPHAKRERLQKEYGVNKIDAINIISDRKLSEFFEHVISELHEWISGFPENEGTAEKNWSESRNKVIKLANNWLLNNLVKYLNKDQISVKECKITPENFAEFVSIVYQRKINSSVSQQILKKMYETGKDPSNIIDEGDLSSQTHSDELDKIIEEAIQSNPDAVQNFKKGKLNAIMFLVGQVMKQTKGKSDPATVKNLIEKKLS